MSSFTSHVLPIWANWAQTLSALTLITAAVAFYYKHRCHHCHRIARYHVGPHQVPTCHKHRYKEAERSE